MSTVRDLFPRKTDRLKAQGQSKRARRGEGMRDKEGDEEEEKRRGGQMNSDCRLCKGMCKQSDASVIAPRLKSCLISEALRSITQNKVHKPLLRADKKQRIDRPTD